MLLGSACVIGGTAEMMFYMVPPTASRTVDATIIGRRTACILEYQLTNESDPRREPMACDKADAFVHANPGKHVHVERHDILQVRYPLEGGVMREAETKITRPGRLQQRIGIGSALSVQYALRNPGEVQVVVPLASLTDLIFLIGFGLVVLLVTFFGTGPSRAKSKPIPVRRTAPRELDGAKFH